MDEYRVTLPAMALRGLVAFPQMPTMFDVSRERSIRAMQLAMEADRRIVLITQKDIGVEVPAQKDLCEVGVVAHIMQAVHPQGENMRLLAEGDARARVLSVYEKDGSLFADVEFMGELFPSREDPEVRAYCRMMIEKFQDFARLSGRIPPDVMITAVAQPNPVRLTDFIAFHALGEVADRCEILACADLMERMDRLLELLVRELEVLESENRINERVRESIGERQREQILREQIHAIQVELGEDDMAELEMYRQRIEESPMPEEAKDKAFRELGRLERMAPNMPEANVLTTWLDWVLDVPWGIESEDNLDLVHAKKILDEDHYGLDKVKERILEYLAVKQLTKSMKGPILCFVGPPGVGKTSIAKSIARAMGREFTRVSLGGLRDEAEIRGHRRTYVGAIPGCIISSLKQAGTANPVFLFDELDKMSHDFRGDPASAMLEVLDAEQNYAFRDLYLDVPVDLSRVLFLATANSLDTIPEPLRDRMEIIEIEGYTQIEKIAIAKRHLFPKQLKEQGLRPKNLRIMDNVYPVMIDGYTREAGVRSLERQIGRAARRAARRIVENPEIGRITITKKNLEEYLGPIRFRREDSDLSDQVGVVRGLAWTSVGGETLMVEVSTMPGSGKVELTGNLGDVMQESAMAALSGIRARSAELQLPENFHKELDIHIHVPEGAVPKDGPSAGITMATAMVSALTGRPVRGDVAMTGEITLRGRVLPIGGLKEKSMAAFREGAKTILFPKGNAADLKDVAQEIRDAVEFIAVSTLDEVLSHALR